MGLNSTTTSISRVITVNNKYGYNVGVKAKYPLGKRIMLNSLLVYTQKGSSTNLDHWREEYNYLELPLLLSYDIGKKSARFYPMIGIQQGYMLSARATSRFTSFSLRSPIVYNPLTSSTGDSEVYRYELGFSIGVGSQFRISSKASVFLDVRYTSGLTNIWKTGTGIFSQRDGIFPDYYNTVLSLNTGVLF